MIVVETQMDGALLEVEMSGHINQDDYTNTLVPAIETALGKVDALRMVVVLGEEFRGFDMGAVWADTQLGLTHWSGFDRLAIVSDVGWITTSIRLTAAFLPCPVQVFEVAEIETARRWIRESLGAVHFQDLGGIGLHVSLMGKLDPTVIKGAEDDLNAEIRARDGLRLLLDLSEFDGWQGLSALGAHFNLIRDHAAIPDRVAVLGDKTWQHMGQRVMRHFLNADTKFFETADIEQAKAWLAEV
ncbi:STAS/SEC14 domain-containing protein [Phaeobacter gallaeciensis]|uniref:STAS/SEC14 domain-containing protein n=2 Tax=Roseobacteraceae TaxID=2854170 RepID=A0A366X063_9RHOB|nr:MULTISPECIES: STAS/SEC14 domain-containing protein [Roseobacteraceae]MBT3139927.1 STAS/SEC14 domain-containing protein [Falsiruegeria litorea]MBT8170269.1 STAS/SEC14 domain-containing protein [Falsiruegeria litorea]RBW56821.1 STAS/SEC14 domain-containing protein [Phaeobacter gallaeciensis]